jgi:hypothetical protein
MYLVAERAQKLLALIAMVGHRLTARELVNPLRDEFACEDGQLPGQVECPTRGGMRMLTDHMRDSLMEVSESRGEATFSETPNPRHECIVEGCKDAARRESCLFDATHFVVLPRNPGVHELAEQGLDALLSPGVDCHCVRIRPVGYAARQTKTSSKNSPARRPVLRLT